MFIIARDSKPLFKGFYLFFLLMILGTSAKADEQDHKGWKIVNYWSKSCAPCRIEIPEFNDLNQTLAKYDIAVLGVNFDEDGRSKTLEIADFMGITFPTLTNEEASALNVPSPSVMPTTYILSPDGSIQTKLVGAQDQQAILDELATLGISIGALRE